MDGKNGKVECDEEECHFPSIHKLPLLVLGKIFKFLSTHDRQSIMQVCQRWHNIINLEVGLNTFIGNGLVYNFPGHKSVKWRSLDVITRVGIDKCVFAELIDGETCDYGDEHVDDEDKQCVKEGGFMLPELVKELSFYGKITNKLFRVILSPVYWLTTLNIHLTVFRLVSFENYTLMLFSLRHLRIFYTHPVFHLSFPFKDDPPAKASIHVNLVKFFATCFFRRIKIFEFVGPYFVDEAKNLVDSIRAFVKRHQISLKELVLSFPYEWNVEGGSKNGEIEVSNKMTSSSSSSSSLLENDEKQTAKQRQEETDWGNVQLHCLQVVCPATVVPPIQAATATQAASFWAQQQLNGCWKTLLEKQCHLASLHYVNKYEDWTFPQAIFLQNADTLKTITLCVNSHFHVDCKVLSCCTNLRKLSLEGNFFHYQDHALDNNNNNNRDENNNVPEEEPIQPEQQLEIDKMQHFSRLFNAHHLPGSLQEICLSKLLIPVAEVEAMVDATMEPKRFPNLESLQLYQICKGYPHFGLTTTAVQHLFNQSNLSVSFWQALNCTSFENVISKASSNVVDSEVMTLMKILEHCDVQEEGEEEGTHGVNLRFSTLYDCHVQLIRKHVRI